MKSLKKINSDHIAIGVTAVIVAVFSLLLYLDFTRKVDVGEAEKIGTITFKKKVAQRKYSGQVVWEDIEQNSPVFNFDSIRTADISEAVIHLEDGTDINIDENSMILLALEKNAINIDFTQGSISAKRGGLTGEDIAEIKIQSKDSTISIDKSDIKLSRTEDEDLSLTVNSGTARIKTGTDEKTIEKDQKVVVSADSNEAKVFKLSLKLESPSHDRYYITTEPAVPVNFSWEPVDGTDTLFLEIARDRSFNNIPITRKVTGTAAAVNLPAGTYYWRLMARNQESGDQDFSDFRKFTVIQDQPVSLISPGENESLEYTVTPPIVQFRWQKNELASEYTVEVARDRNFTEKVKSVTTPLTEIAMDNLTASTYFWRIKTQTVISGTSHQSVSPVRSIKIDKTARLAPPRLIAPVDDKKVSARVIDDKGLVFSWEPDAQVSRYELIFSEDDDFTSIASSTRVNGNFFTLRSEIPPGTYFWRVRPLRDDGTGDVYSQNREFTVLESENITITAPSDETVVNVPADTRSATVTFRWEPIDIPGKYLFELSKEMSFMPLYTKRITGDSNIAVEGIEPGAYYWRVTLVDLDNSKILLSDPYALEVQKQLVTELTINSGIPKSSIRVNDKFVGYNTASVNPEPGEKLNIEVAAPGYEKFTRTVTLEAGEKRVVQARFVGKPELTVTSSVPGSKIFINDKLMGNDSVTFTPEAGKAFTVVVKAERYNDYTRRLVLNSGEKKTLRANLDRIKAKDRKRWDTNLGSPIVSQPLIHENMLMVTTRGGRVTSFDRTGNQIWSRYLPGGANSTLAAGGKSLYAVDLKGNFLSMDVMNGNTKWERDIGGPLLFGSRPLVIDDMVYVANSYGEVRAYDKDGEEQWEKKLGGGIFHSMTHYREKNLIVGTDDLRIYSLKVRNGSIRWNTLLGSRMISASPRVHQKNIFIGCYDGTFYSLKGWNGWIRWKFKTEKSIFSTPAFKDDLVFFGSEDGFIYALDVDSGEEVWKLKTGSIGSAEPAVNDDTLYVATGNAMFAIKPDSGEIKWKQRLPSRVNTPPTVMGNDIFVGLENGQVVSLRSDLYLF